MSDVVEDLGSLTDCYVILRNGKKALLVTDADAAMPKVPADQYFTISNGTPTTLTDPAVMNTYTLEVVNASTYSIGDVILLTTGTASYVGVVLLVAGTTITVDSLLNFAYPAGTPAASRSREINVDGSTTPITFEIFLPAGILVEQINTCRFMMQCQTDTAVDLSKFGDIIGGITRGVLLRGVPDPSSGLPITNSWNAKTNGELSILAYDWNAQTATNPAQGQDGFLWRYTYGGDDKHGVIPPINVGDKIEFIVQDDITSLLKLNMLFGGNFLIGEQ